MPDQEKLADDVDTEMQRIRRDLADIIRAAAHHTLRAIADRGESAGTGQLADLAYAFACLEGAQRGVLPATPPPKNSAPPEISPRRPTSAPQPGSTYPPLSDTTRTSR